MLKICLTEQLDVFTIHEFVPKFLDNDRNPLSDSFQIDLTSISFVKPGGVTALANIISYLVSKGCSVALIHPNPQQLSGATKYLDDCGFFELFFNKKIGPFSACRETTIPLKSLVYSEYDAWLGYTVIPWLSGCIGLNIERQWPSFSTVLGEIFNNINDHAGEQAKIASTLMQHFPKINKVEIAISDFGIGIPARVRAFNPSIVYDHDCDTIMQAVQDNFSTKTSPRNRGAGLDTIISNAVHYNKGTVEIMSGYGSVKFMVNGTARYAYDVNYPGTLLHLTLRTDTIKDSDNCQEDLSW